MRKGCHQNVYHARPVIRHTGAIIPALTSAEAPPQQSSLDAWLSVLMSLLSWCSNASGSSDLMKGKLFGIITYLPYMTNVKIVQVQGFGVQYGNWYNIYYRKYLWLTVYKWNSSHVTLLPGKRLFCCSDTWWPICDSMLPWYLIFFSTVTLLYAQNAPCYLVKLYAQKCPLLPKTPVTGSY